MPLLKACTRLIQPRHSRPAATLSAILSPTSSPSSPLAKRARLDADMSPQGPPGWAENVQDYGAFKLLTSFPIKYAPVGVAKWRSERTGLTVVVGSHEAPVTNGHFAVASEIFDDSGRPHTLEHLVFLGSKKYPFKGVLDQLANRAGSDGTNAWTANDHTAYTIATAGAEGFLKMLPIYIDHILHPTITDAGFVTEVHHITGTGEDAGVVYSEMQARENTAGDLMALEAQRMLYPKTSAYRSETGGLMSALRTLTAEQSLALKILAEYLTSSATSPLQKEFVEIPKPYCSGISFTQDDRVNTIELSCFIADVPVKYGERILGMVVDKLRAIVKEGIDMAKMDLVLRRDKRRLLNSMETSVSSVLADCAISDFLYGGSADLPEAFEDLRDYDALAQWTDTDWRALIERYYLQPAITTVGKPSAALSAKIEQDEKARVAQRKLELGEDRLKELDAALAAAKAESDTPPPDSMITSFPITDPNSLTWVPVSTEQKAAHFTHVKSNFITISALFDTIDVPAEIKPYFCLLQAAILSSGVTRDGVDLTHEQVIDQLDDFTVSQHAYFTFSGMFSELFTLELKVEVADYEKALGWMRDLVAGLRFEPDRLEVILAKLLQELPYEKRDGARVADAYLYQLAFDDTKSTSEACSLLCMLEFVPATMQLLKDDPDAVIAKLNEARRHRESRVTPLTVLNPSVLRVSVRGNVQSLPDEALRSFLPITQAAPLSHDTLTALGKSPSKKCILVPMPAIEGSYSTHFARGISGFDHPDLPALKLAVATLNAGESYLWKAVRGSGLAYGARVSSNSETGLTSYSVYRSPNAHQAYEEAGKVLRGLVDGSIELDQNIVDGARSMLTYSYARASETVMAAAATAYLDEVLKGVGKDNNKRLLAIFPTITLDQIREAIAKYLLPIFSSETSICAVTVSTGKADEVEEGFKGLGFEVERKVLPSLGSESDESDEESDGESEDGDSA